MVEAVDQEQTIYKYSPDGVRYDVVSFAFLPNVIAGLTCFKVKEDPATVYTVSGQSDARLDFKRRCGDLGLSGIAFKPVWRIGPER
jgi:hypothetical protein